MSFFDQHGIKLEISIRKNSGKSTNIQKLSNTWVKRRNQRENFHSTMLNLGDEAKTLHRKLFLALTGVLEMKKEQPQLLHKETRKRAN